MINVQIHNWIRIKCWKYLLRTGKCQDCKTDIANGQENCGFMMGCVSYMNYDILSNWQLIKMCLKRKGDK